MAEWKDGLLLKAMKTVPCLSIINLLEAMLSNRKYRVHMGNKMSRWKPLCDSPETESREIKYADDEVLVTVVDTFAELEETLTSDLLFRTGD